MANYEIEYGNSNKIENDIAIKLWCSCIFPWKCSCGISNFLKRAYTEWYDVRLVKIVLYMHVYSVSTYLCVANWEVIN